MSMFRNIVARKFCAIVILNDVKNLAQIVASRDEILRRSAQDDIARQRGNAAAIRRRAALPNPKSLDLFPRALAKKNRVIGLWVRAVRRWQCDFLASRPAPDDCCAPSRCRRSGPESGSAH